MTDYRLEIAKAINTHLSEMSFDEIKNTIEYPKNKDMGDFAFPCFKLAKALKKSPASIAESLAKDISAPFIESINPVAGFLNFRISKNQLAFDTINTILTEKDNYATLSIGQNQNITIDYSAPNIAKPFHVGHLRSTMIGESIKRILAKIGYNPIAINHLGDYGTQFGKLIVAFKKWGDETVIKQNPIRELQKLYVHFHEEAEKNPELDDEAREYFTKLEAGDEETITLWKFFTEVSLAEFERLYNLLGVDFDHYLGESFYSDKLTSVIQSLNEKNLLKESQGTQIVDLESYGLIPALVTKKDGSSLYLTRDLATAIFRHDHFNFYKNLYVVGMTQKLHFQQVFAVLREMGYDWVDGCIHIPFGQVSLEGMSLSTRKGQVVYLEDVLKEAIDKVSGIIEEKNPNLANKENVARQVGVGAVVFQELFTSREKDYTFSLDKVISFVGETGPYVQYTHARSCAVLRKAGMLDDTGVNYDYFGDINSLDYSVLEDDASQELLKALRRFGEVLITASNTYEPHIVARYICELASLFNTFYQENPILIEDENIKKARLSVVLATKITLKLALSMVCLEAPENM